MTNLEYLKGVKPITIGSLEEDRMPIASFAIDLRKVKALEIIAEELIKHNENSGHIVTALENIDTTLNRR